MAQLALVLLLALSVAVAEDTREWLRYNRRMPGKYDELGMARQLRRSAKIVGGTDANIADFPYQLSLRRSGVHGCGASIVAPRWALSAAHCTYPIPAAGVITLRAGSENRLDGGTIYSIDWIVNHPDYSDYTLEFDVSVLRVTTDFVGLYISAVTIPPATSGFAPGTRAVISGWGLQGTPGALPVILKWTDVPLLSREQCAYGWPSEWITDDMLCASQPGRDTCNGDSGSPLVVSGYQMGVASWGTVDCSGYSPAVYASVAHPKIHSFIVSYVGS